MADLVFILCMSVVMKKIDGQLRHADLIIVLPSSPSCEILGIDGQDLPLATPVMFAAWADDLATPIIGHSSQILQEAGAALTIVWNVFLQFAMALNMKEGKTAFMHIYGGQGQVRARVME